MTREHISELLTTNPHSHEEQGVVEKLGLRWDSALQDPLWYEILRPELETLTFAEKLQDSRLKWLRSQFYRTIKLALSENRIPLAAGPEKHDFDTEREPINTIVIHHTEGKPETDLDDLNSLGFLRQYTADFMAGTVLGKDVTGKAVGSGHFMDNRQVFYAYHWLVTQDGQAFRLLDDAYIGWHAGNWNVNKRSIGIALAGNFDKVAPSENEINGLATLINSQYAFVEPQKIIGHYETNFKKSCPGETFANEWRQTLFDKLTPSTR